MSSTRKAVQADHLCPCGFGSAYGECCGLMHAGTPAPTAAQLMRSRYSALALGLGDYLVRSWHPDTLPAGLTAAELAGDDGTRWVRLIVEEVVDGGPFSDEGEVTFTAIARTPEGRVVQRERSRFVRATGADRRWLYLDGVAL